MAGGGCNEISSEGHIAKMFWGKQNPKKGQMGEGVSGTVWDQVSYRIRV